MSQRKIVLLGLSKDLANLNAMKGEIWTLNDFYVPGVYGRPPFPKFNPTYVFQIHDMKLFSDKWLKGQQKIGRWLYDWKEIYNRYSQKVIGIEKIKGIDNCEVFDMDKAKKQFGSWCLTSTCSYMLIQAFWEGIDCVRLNGFPQIDEGYSYQMPGTYLLIEVLRGMGMMIQNPFEVIWEQMLVDFDWKGFMDLDISYGPKGGKAFKKFDFYSKDAPKAIITIKDSKKENNNQKESVL